MEKERTSRRKKVTLTCALAVYLKHLFTRSPDAGAEYHWWSIGNFQLRPCSLMRSYLLVEAFDQGL